MPVFDFECKCGEAFEFYQFNSADAPTCPTCGSTRVTKLISVPAAVFGDLNDFSNENNGRGRWNDQLGQHVKSVRHANDIAKRKGYVKAS